MTAPAAHADEPRPGAPTVLVSGSGVAGPALALRLARHGLRPTVVEIAPALRPGGQAVDFRGRPSSAFFAGWGSSTSCTVFGPAAAR